MSSKRPESRAEAPKPKKDKVTLETVKQGIEQLYPAEDSTSPINLEYV